MVVGGLVCFVGLGYVFGVGGYLCVCGLVVCIFICKQLLQMFGLGGVWLFVVCWCSVVRFWSCCLVVGGHGWFVIVVCGVCLFGFYGFGFDIWFWVLGVGVLW